MPRYIDADKLKDDIAVLFERNEQLIDEWLANCVDDVIDEQTTADVVSVVRCKDCYFAIPYNEKWLLPKKNNCMWCKLYEDVRSLDWFCADGERRTDDDH